jgi:hypothetical protein
VCVAALLVFLGIALVHFCEAGVCMVLVSKGPAVKLLF